MSSSGMWSRVDPGLSDVSKECIASILMVEKSGSLQPYADAGSPVADSSTLKMEAILSSENSVN
jgi:hypothetical protein